MSSALAIAMYTYFNQDGRTVTGSLKVPRSADEVDRLIRNGMEDTRVLVLGGRIVGMACDEGADAGGAGQEGLG